MAAGDMVGGVFLYWTINFVGGFAVLGASNGGSHPAAVAIGAVVFALIAFGGGGALLAVRSRRAKAIGLGLMIGWPLTSIFTVGICTGLNPVMYKGS